MFASEGKTTVNNYFSFQKYQHMQKYDDFSSMKAITTFKINC